MKGYFGIGIERASKPMNMGNLVRSAHAFGASFIFTLAAHYRVREARSDTSKTQNAVPWYDWDDLSQMQLPKGCQLVGVELADEAIALPRFTHPRRAAYILGPERGSLAENTLAACHHVVKIPTKFCVNVQIAGAVIMYDRLISLGYPDTRPVMPGGIK